MIERRALIAIAAIIDIASRARGTPVPAGALAARQGRSPRTLETILRDLARARILKGTRGPRGGYELARERRRISLGDIVRAVGRTEPDTRLPTTKAVSSAVDAAIEAALGVLDETSVAQVLMEEAPPAPADADPGAFVI